MDHKLTPIWTAVDKYSNSNITHFDVPGHKKKDTANIMSKKLPETFRRDVNSSPILDFLLNPDGVIDQAHALIADVFGAKEAFILTNGTTQGIHTLIASSVYPGELILIPRNAHKSTINGVILAGAVPIWIETEMDSEFSINHNITPESFIEAVEKYPGARTTILLNPTYFGVVSNLKEIVEIAKLRGITVLTDEAHGAHFNFNDKLPMSGIEAGVDACALSFHKTLGSLTQSSVIVWNPSEQGIQSRYIWQWNSILTTTSPNYLLMSSVDAARSKFALEGKELTNKAIDLANYAREELSKIDGVDVFGIENEGKPGIYKIDPTKIVVKTTELGYTGFDMYDTLITNYGIQVELGEIKVFMAIITFNDEKEDVDKLINALKDISLNNRKEVIKISEDFKYIQSSNQQRILTPREAIARPVESIKMTEARGRVAADTLLFYPPGIPLVLPGELITEGVINYFSQLQEQEVKFITAANADDEILVIKDLKIEGE